jgi:hypothetical protein
MRGKSGGGGKGGGDIARLKREAQAVCLCLCGCGKQVPRRFFRPGHDARMRAQAGETTKAR